MAGTLIDNPIAWAHFKVRGGWKNHLWSVGIYTLAIVLVIGITIHLSPMGGALLGPWTNGLLALELAILIFYGCNVISNSIRRDITSGLLESHRLMPISPGAAIVGYLMGPTFQALLLALSTFIIGTAMAAQSNVMDQWLMANIIGVLFVMFVWVGVAFTAFVAKGAFGIIFGLMIWITTAGVSSIDRGGSNRGGVMEFIPAFTVLITPMQGRTIFSLISRSQPVTLGYAWGFLAQFLMGAIFFRGAMRRYRRDDLPALSTLLGILLLAVWASVSVVGMARSAEFQATARSGLIPVFRQGRPYAIAAMISTLLTSMLIAIAPISASARASLEWSRTFYITGHKPGKRPSDPPLIAIIATLLLLPIVYFFPPQDMPLAEAAIRVAMTLLSFFMSICFLLWIFFRNGRKPFVIIAGYVIISWIIPLGIEALLQDNSGKPATVALLSPWGTFTDLWSSNPSRSWIGLFVQIFVAIACGVLYSTTRPKHRTPGVAVA